MFTKVRTRLASPVFSTSVSEHTEKGLNFPRTLHSVYFWEWFRQSVTLYMIPLTSRLVWMHLFKHLINHTHLTAT
jgi:hypothetical protein